MKVEEVRKREKVGGRENKREGKTRRGEGIQGRWDSEAPVGVEEEGEEPERKKLTGEGKEEMRERNLEGRN